MSREDELHKLWEKLHQEACANGQDFYRDPETGYLVGTALALKKRKCCRCGCRHCPYGFKREVEG